MVYKFTNRAEKALELANELAIELGHNYIGTEHILYGLSKEGTGVASKVLESQEVDPDNIISEIEMLIGRGEPLVDENSVGFTPRSKRIIENAFIEARKLGSEFIGTEHLLIGIMREGDSVAVRIMMDLGVNPQKLYNEIVKVINEDNQIYLEGANKAFELPEFKSLEVARNFINLIDTKEIVVDLLNTGFAKDINVYIGDENDNEQLKDFSIVTFKHRYKDRDLGTIGIIGPKRMDYSKVISVMKYINHKLNGKD